MKYQVSILKCVIMIMSHFLCFALNAQVYSDEYLLKKGKEFYEQNKFREAAAFLFAYIQKEPTRLLNDPSLKTKIEQALKYSTKQIDEALAYSNKQNEASSDAKFDQVGKHSHKPSLNVNNQNLANFQGNLDGTWSCNSVGGIYYIRKVGNDVWWFGRNKGETIRWSNVFYGKIEGNKIYGEWVDVPVGNTTNKGSLTVQILSPTKFVKLNQQGQITSTEWIRE